MHEPDHLTVVETDLPCADCGGAVDHVHAEVPDRADSWAACPECGYDSVPAWYQPGAYYRSRY
jgi:DNA-directed RNA polymerase subunit RPC12/RpoP